ncbi:MAG: hypothetical protein WA708_17565 [Acidobacteriaceae bacterium]
MKKLSAILVFLAMTICAARPQTATSTAVANSNGTVTITTVYTPAATVVTPPPPVVTLPVISSFTAAPASIVDGGAAILAWTTTGATTATLDGMAEAVSDASYLVTPATTTTYVLTATNSAGSVTQNVTVTVTAAAPPPVEPTGTALTACGDLTKTGTYYLANDVSSTEGCFGIDANGITLNLNGHTITYDTGGAVNAPAIEGHDCWSTVNPVITGPCSSAHGGLEVYGGAIVQAVSASTFSPVFEFGQSNSISPAPYIHDITATFQNTGAQFYYSQYVPAGAKIENNVIYDNVTDIDKPGQGDLSARSAFQGQAIYVGQNNENPGVGDTISGNKIVGSPQGGVRTVNQHSTISGNDISMNATYSNDFCADVPADYTTVSGNNCHPLSGRGFHITASHVALSGNTIAVTELKQNAEYGGCEIDGAYGVQVEYDDTLPTQPESDAISTNTIAASAGACPAIGLRVSGTAAGAGAAFTGNTVTTTNTGAGAADYALSFDGANGSGITFTGNTFSAKNAYVDIDWDGASAFTIGANTWKTVPTYTVMALDGGCDPTQTDTGAACPTSATLTDTLPETVSCGPYSEATVTIDGKATVCKAKQ